MTWNWLVRDRNVIGHSSWPTPSAVSLNLAWSPNDEEMQFPWPSSRYPGLLILGIGFSSTTVGAGTRRLQVQVIYPGLVAPIFDSYTAQGQPGATSRRWELRPDFALTTPLVLTYIREPLPRNLVLTPVSGTRLSLSWINGQAGDAITAGVSITGRLLFD